MISVIIPSYNRAETIRRSVDSVLNQTYSDIEVIVVDDCSTDNTIDIISNYDDRVRCIRHEQNRGACAARNTGIMNAKGEYIAFQDSDDEWFPDKLEKQIKALESSGSDVVFCQYTKLENGKESVGPLHFPEGVLGNVTTLYGIGTQTLLAKASVFQNIKFDIRMPRFQDLEWLIRAKEHYQIYCLAEPLVRYNLGNDSISVNPRKLYAASEFLLILHPDLLKKYPLMAESTARRLFLEARMLPRLDFERFKMCLLALRYKISMKNIVKFVLWA
jgi:glycosyltransferase involved in cell wall biosynthesis